LLNVFGLQMEQLTRQKVYVQCNIEACLCNHCCSGKAISIAYSEYVFIALGIQHAICICQNATCGLPSSTIFFHFILWLALFFSVFWYSLQLLSETFLILRRTERDVIENVYWSLHKVPIIIVQF